MDRHELTKFQKSIENKINEISKDQLIYNSIKEFDLIASHLEIQYSIIGSCGVRSFLPYFSHLPNDLDVVVDDLNKSKLKEYCRNKKIAYFEQLGRDRIQIGGFLIHLIPNRMNIIDKPNNKIFTQINLDINDENTETREFILASCTKELKLKVHIKEIQFLLSLLTPINTTIFHDLISLLEYNKFKTNCFIDFLNLNLNIKPLFRKRFQELISISNRLETNNIEINMELEIIYDALFKIEN